MEAAEKRIGQAFATALLIAILALTSIALFAAPTTGTEQVTISGHLLADGAPFNDAIVVVEVEHEACLWSELRADGHFEFHVPVGSKARLIFLKPGFLQKEVEVDTRNALITDHAEKLNKKVKFDVMLEAVEEHVHETYLGPVGYITFVNGSGLMRVRYDGRMKPVAAEAALKP